MILRALLLWAVLGALFASTPAWADKPHIVVIMADDLGWGDVGYHGSDIPTDTIDALAAEGVELNQLYVHATGFQTRAALLTGRYPHRYGFQGIRAASRDEDGLPKAEKTLAQLLKDTGYKTHLIGKWTLGDSEGYLPLDRGFDHHYGPLGSEIHQYSHADDGELDWYRDGKLDYGDGYAQTLLTDEAIRALKQNASATPVYLQLNYLTPRKPLKAPQKYIRRHLDDPEPERRLYEAMMDSWDDELGRLMATIDELGIKDDTIVVFMSDNGGDVERSYAINTPLRGGKDRSHNAYDGALRVPGVIRWTGTLEPQKSETPVHAVDLFTTLASAAKADAGEADGVDLLPHLVEGRALADRALLLDVGRRTSVLRKGNYKLIATQSMGSGPPSREEAMDWEPDEIELYDLSNDPSEETNLAETNPAMVASMLEEARKALADAQPPGMMMGRRMQNRGQVNRGPTAGGSRGPGAGGGAMGGGQQGNRGKAGQQTGTGKTGKAKGQQ